MDKINKIRIVGSGPIALFLCWSLTQIENNSVVIVSDRLVSTSHSYQIYIDNAYLPKLFSPNSIPSSDLLHGYSDLYIVCDSPTKSTMISDKLQSYHPDSQVLIVSSYTSDMGHSNVYFDRNRFYAWPLVSVETANGCIVSTNFLQLSLYDRNIDTRILMNLTNIFNLPNCINIGSNSNTFMARSVLTFALYSFMIRCESINDFQDSSIITDLCTPLVLEIADKLGLVTADFPDFDPTFAFVDQLNLLFTQLTKSSLHSPASMHNLVYLLSKKEKLSRYISVYSNYF